MRKLAAVCQHNRSKEILARIAIDAVGVTLSSSDTRQQRATDETNESFLCADAPECESGLGFHDLPIHLEQRIDEKIDWAARRLRIDHQVPAFC